MTNTNDAKPDIAPAIETYLPLLRRYANSLTRNRASAEDLVQGTVLRALEKQHLFQPETNLRAWLLTIMHNEHVNATRRAIRDPLFVSDEVLNNIGRPGSEVVQIELHEMRTAIARLPRIQRLPLLMHWRDGMRYGEIAKALAVPLGTVQSRISRARATLRAILADPNSGIGIAHERRTAEDHDAARFARSNG
jgi:RNA polymerase sigma-70 factor (ECF subfamily)